MTYKNPNNKQIIYEFHKTYMENLIEYGLHNSKWPIKGEKWKLIKEQTSTEEIKGRRESCTTLTLECLTNPNKGEVETIKRIVEMCASIVNNIEN